MILPGNCGLSAIKMESTNHFGLPKLVVGLLSCQMDNNGIVMKWKIFNSGQYTELKLIWCPTHANKMGHSARISSHHKAPSAVRRDQDRKQQYVAKGKQHKEQHISVKDTIDVSTQCEDKRVTRSRSRNF